MSVKLANSASALNDGVWANRFAEFLSDGGQLPFLSALSNRSPVYSTLPMPVPSQHSGLGYETAFTPTDGYYDLQWHFAYMGDIETIWDEYSGADVHVGVYDDGLQTDHPDLAANYDPSREVTVDGQILNPLESTVSGAPHGTAVAGLIAAANNGTGVVGVAWGASLTGVNIFSGAGDINNYYAGFLQAASQSSNFDVINHSWGKFPGFWQDVMAVAQDDSLLNYWFEALEIGRNGLGTIQVKAAGNQDQNSNGDGTTTSRATIIVGAYDDDGDASYYSSYGANLLVSAPSSGYSDWFTTINRGLVTTDNTGYINAPGRLDYGYNGLPDTDYTNGFGGTSGATPIVTGVVALMLEANPDLGWRDVQNIIAYSAHEVGSGVGGVRRNDENNTWKYNGADNWNGGGLHYSEDYGYGGINAYNAVRMAEVWNLFGGPKTSANESSFKQSTTQSVELLDGKTTDIHFTFGGPDFTVDFVNVSIDLHHTKLDDLEIYLISPDGTTSTLVDFRFELFYNGGAEDAVLTFGANGFRGENGTGEWTIRIVDRWEADSGTLNSASITLHGTDTADGTHNTSDDVYHYTDEVFTAIAREGERIILNDADGGTDWLDLAAMTGDIRLRMSEGWTSAVDGKSFLIVAKGSLIENAVAGDGNDDLEGTRYDNVIYGMRGNDRIQGHDGNDTLSGGAGNDTLIGGIGSDIFLFDRALNAATNVDTIVDFNGYEPQYGVDLIWLDNSIFNLVLGILSADAFTLGTGALDASDRIIYDAATGALYYDVDGNGLAASVQFAILGNKPTTLTYSDFLVVDTTGTVVTGTGTDRVQPDAETTSTSTDTQNLFGPGVPINGTQYADEILGKEGDDIINGLGGDDTLAGYGGNDTIDGGAGIDQIFGLEGNDTLHGGGSPDWIGDNLYGGDGNDILYGSNQPNGIRYSLFPNGDFLYGGAGDDILYGLDGDDAMHGDGDGDDRFGGNDILYGGGGNDNMAGGWGSDHFYGGLGYNTVFASDGGEIADSVDTIHFDGNFSEYRIVGMQPQGWLAYYQGALTVQRTSGLAAGEVEQVEFEAEFIEVLQFADRTIDLRETPLLIRAGGDTDEVRSIDDWVPINVTTHGFEKAVIVDYGTDVTITDAGDANGVDALNYVRVNLVSGNVQINADSLEILEIDNLTSDVWSQTYGFPGFTGDLAVNAAAGDRELSIFLLGVRLDAGETVSDNTATSIVLNQMTSTDWLNGAAIDDFNLSFASAETIKFYQTSGLSIKWYVPNATTIDLSPTFDGSTQIASNYGYVRIDTPLDDSVLAPAGGLAEYRFIGGLERDFVRLGNLGSVNAGNDGSPSDISGANAGLGLRGTITLDAGSDEVHILGSGAFQGGTIDAGWNGEADQQYNPDADTIRMTFGVAEAIGDISSHISGFEVLQLDVTSQSHSVNVANFDGLTSVRIAGTEGSGGNNTVTLVDGSSVEFRAVNNATRFGTVNLLGSTSGVNLAFSAPFERIGPVDGFLGNETVPAEEAASGTVRVVDATVVNIVTNSRDDVRVVDLGGGRMGLEALPPIDSFEQVLVLDSATTVNISGDTGWDFTVAGSDISKVTRIDGSGVTGTGTVGAIVATAQTTSAVHFTGGAGDDVFTGGAGNDTLEGGAGNDTYIIDAGSVGDTFIEAANGGTDTAQSDSVNLDLNLYTNIENAELKGSLDLAITGNAARNVLTGNAGNNLLDGGAAADTAVFSGNRSDYTVLDNGDGSVTVTDTRVNPQDGSDTLVNVEYLQFADGRHSVNPSAPTDIYLSNYTVLESSYENLLVGLLAATDAEGDTATFELVDDSNGRFTLVNGNEIRTVYHTLLDYEQQTTYDITIRVTDGDGLTYEKTLTIDLLDYNPEYMVGRGDIDTDDVIWGGAYNDLLAGNGGNDTFRGNGGSDIIIGGLGDHDTAEYSGSIADYEIIWAKDYSNAFTIRDKRSNPDGTGFDGIDYVTYDLYTLQDGTKVSTATEYLKFADGVLNTWDFIAPTDIALSSLAVTEGVEAGTEVGTLTATDLSSFYGETFSFTLLDNAGGRFALDGDKIVVAGALDYEAATSHEIRVRVTDGDGHTFEKTLTIAVTDVPNENEAPTDILPDTASVAENSANGAEVATLAAVDPNAGDTFTFELVDNAGGRFEIVGNKLVVKDSTGLDYEAATSHTVVVKVTDAGGLSVEQEITVNVTDVDENTAPTVSLANTLLSIAENTSTASRVKVADIVLTDDGLGT
ncbi:S8 family serine peptidase, partial [Hyphomicrobium sp. LHD-15]|uniref:S8 family serine peptidase n=1 Tax=Hyphomicrobium sp. LHD-15 TaxID=3072142 RepID=UPI00280E2FED